MHTTQLTYVVGHPLVDLYLEFSRALGAPDAGAHLEVWPSPADARAVDAFLSQAGLSDSPALVCLHPGGATRKEQRWSEERYTEFARLCEDELNLRPLFIGGPGDEDVLARVGKLTDGRYPISAALPLPASAELIGRCRLFVGSDSAPSHLAAAMGTPRIVLYGPFPKLPLNLRSWATRGADGPPARVMQTGLFCLECHEFPCSQTRMRECAATLTPREVLAEARPLLP